MSEWRPVVGYEDVYKISENGEVVRVETGKTLKPSLAKNGYYVVALWHKNRGKSHHIHQLVAEAFLPNPNGFKTINHKDGNKLNNDISNLEWCSYSENNKHAYDKGLKVPSRKVVESARRRAIKRNETDHPRLKPIDAFDLFGNLIASFGSTKEAAKELNIHRSTISKSLKGEVNSPKKYVFKYKEVE